MEVVSRDVAEQEIESWLSIRKVRQKKIEGNEDQMENLIEAVQEGLISVNDDGVLTQKLNWPVGENDYLKELKYKVRLKVADSHKHLSGLKAGDMDGRMLAYVCALTNQSKTLIGGMDSDDYGIANSIVVFFL